MVVGCEQVVTFRGNFYHSLNSTVLGCFELTTDDYEFDKIFVLRIFCQEGKIIREISWKNSLMKKGLRRGDQYWGEEGAWVLIGGD